MSLLSLIAVFLIEQLQPLDYRRIIAEPLGAWADFIESRFNAGAFRHGVLAWCLAVLLPVALWIKVFKPGAEHADCLAADIQRCLVSHAVYAQRKTTGDDKTGARQAAGKGRCGVHAGGSRLSAATLFR